MSIEFRAFDHEDGLAQQRALFADAFPENQGTGSTSVEHYKWKFHGAPHVPHSYEYSANEEGRMLGYYAAIPYSYQLGEHTVKVGMVCDVMTHSQARGQGLFTRLGGFALAEMEAAGLDLVTGYPIRPEVMGGHLRVGWQVAFELPMYIRPLKGDAILRSKGLAWLAPAVNAGMAAHRWLLTPRRGLRAYTCRVGTPEELLRTPAFARLVAGWSESVPNHLVKSAEYYAWRLGAPGTRYQVFTVFRGDQVVAAAIGRVADLHGIPSLALLDLMVATGEERALPALYHTLSREARRQGVEAIVTMMSRHRARQYRLVRFGFLKSPYTFKLILRSLKESISVKEISSEEDWHLMWIDSDDL